MGVAKSKVPKAMTSEASENDAQVESKYLHVLQNLDVYFIRRTLNFL